MAALGWAAGRCSGSPYEYGCVATSSAAYLPECNAQAAHPGHYARMASSPEPWFTVRCVLKHEDFYEERLTLWLADDFDGAIALAESDAHAHAEVVGVEYVGLAQAFHLFESDLRPGVEVFSLIRQSELEPADYLSTFFDTGTELQQHSDG